MTIPHVPDCDLARRLRHGDPKAPEELVRRHGGSLLALARRLLGDAGGATRCVPEAFWRAFAAAAAAPDDLDAWLKGMLVEAARRAAGSDGDGGDELIALLPTFTADGRRAHDIAAGANGAARRSPAPRTDVPLQACVDRLPPLHRMALVLCDIEAVAAPVAAAWLGIDAKILRQRVHEARMALCELVERPFAAPAGSR